MSAGPRSPLRGFRVAVLGRGRAGRAFAAALAARGAEVTRWSRSSSRTAGQVGRERDLLLFCVRDDAIREVAARIAREWEAASVPRRERAAVALHTSGFHGVESLRSLARAGVATGSIHPLVPLTGERSAGDLHGAWFAVGARGRALATARRVVRGLEGRELRLSPGGREKRAWHLACALVANGAVSLFDLALEHAGERAAPALAGMLEIVAGRLAQGPRAALTGPVARGEREVVLGHLALLRRRPDEARLYRLLSRRLLALSTLPPKERRAIARLLR